MRSDIATCRHPEIDHVDRLWLLDEPLDIWMMTSECVACGYQWLSLGPATITPAVAIEIRAAFIASGYRNIGGLPRPITDELCRGWSNAEMSMADHTDEWLAGWLGHVIYSHGKEGT